MDTRKHAVISATKRTKATKQQDLCRSSASFRQWGFPAVLILTGLFVFLQLFREIWFDEALTISLIARNTGITDLYFAYEIPNNHIVYSMLLAKWVQLLQFFSPDIYPWMYRLLSGITGLCCAAVLYRILIRKAGLISGTAAVFLWICSPVFLTFATGIRGYILGAFLILCLYCTAWKCYRSCRLKYLVLFFLIVLLAAGTAPTNLAGAAGVLILFFPSMLLNRNRGRRRGIFIIMCFMVLLSVPVFYGANFRELLGCLKLGEGWSSPGAAVWNLYSAWGILLLPLGISAAAGFCRAWGKFPQIRCHLLAGLMILLLPLPAYILFKAPPFPRVFFPLSPLVLLVLAFFSRFCFRGIFRQKSCRRSGKLSHYFVIFCLLWGFAGNRYAEQISSFLYGRSTADDLIQPYYMHRDFVPQKMIMLLQQFLSDPAAKVFLSFRADYPALMYAAFSAGISQDKLCCDLPNLPPFTLKPEERKHFYILSADEDDLQELMTRFQLQDPVSIPGGTSLMRLDRFTD